MVFAGSGARSPRSPRFRQRVIHWRDFPEQNMLTIAELPMDEQTRSSKSTSVAVLELLRGSQPAETQLMRVTMGLFVQQVGSWAGASLRSLCDAKRKLFQSTLGSIGGEALVTLQKADRDLYCVLSLRTCPGGWPLLPGNIGDTRDVKLPPCKAPEAFRFWHRWTGEFSFASYLQGFLEGLGVSDTQVFSTMNGKPLAFFQAAVIRSHWRLLADWFDHAWQCQTLAYQQDSDFSLRHTPKICDHKTARFAVVEDPEASIEDEKSPVSVRRTFIHVDDDPLCPAQHARSKSK